MAGHTFFVGTILFAFTFFGLLQLVVLSDCPDGFFGTECKSECPENCESKICGQDHGNCTGCKRGFYGYRCFEVCSSHCGDKGCEQTEGDCIECPDGFYDKTCNLRCPSTCKGSVCDRTDGTCTECQEGFYHKTCNRRCSSTCKGNVCDRTDGTCTECKTDFYGPKCKERCPRNCVNNNCEKTSGDCIECKAGFYGSECKERCPKNCEKKTCKKTSGDCFECPVGFYGSKCNSKCPTNCEINTCKQTSGDCFECKPGFYGSECKEWCPKNCEKKTCKKTGGHCFECAVGFYDSKCNSKCPTNCGSNTCKQTSGDCVECKKGFFGSKCQNQCPTSCGNNTCEQTSGACFHCAKGYYDSNCQTPCPTNCLNKMCEEKTGHCFDCASGYYGSKCQIPCPTNCLNKTCEEKTGYCSGGCVDGKYGLQCQHQCLDSCLTCDKKGGNCSVKGTKQIEGEGSDVTLAVFCSLGGILVVVVIIVVCIVKRRKTSSSREDASVPSIRYEIRHSSIRQNNLSGESSGQTLNNLQNGSASGALEDTDNLNNERQRGLSVEMLKILTAKHKADEENCLKSEFESLQSGACYPITIGKNNVSKNRYKKICPYDHSRVILDPLPGEIGSDYINANYIDSVEKKEVYVAAQGPLPTTNNDFWRMIWKLNSGKIVMLTNVVENQKVKCDKYWPEEGEILTTKTFIIKLNRERYYASYVIRDIIVTDCKSKEKREIHQFHFTAWPDHGTPNLLELVLFQRRVKLHKTVLPGQMVIHCSAGIGRTGTFIAFDALVEHGKKHDWINIHSFVNKMRNDRMHMIQTLGQYVALHEILAEAFNLHDTLIPKSVFIAKYHALSTMEQHGNQTKLIDEFKLMVDLKPEYKLEQDFQASLLPENKTKNRTMQILAVDKFRAFLPTDASNSNDYINAILTQSYISKQGYIATQFPLPDTRADFWTLVMTYQCDTVVILGEESDPEPDSQWMPANNKELNIGEITLKQNGTQTEFKGVEVIVVSITRKHVATDHTSRIFRMKEWTTERQVPQSKQSILHLLEQVESRRRSVGNKPVLVTCKDGSTQCGLFCLMANTRDQLKMDEEVDVLQAARQLQIRRPEFLATFDQYQYCYAILNSYLETTDCYVN